MNKPVKIPRRTFNGVPDERLPIICSRHQAFAYIRQKDAKKRKNERTPTLGDYLIVAAFLSALIYILIFAWS